MFTLIQDEVLQLLPANRKRGGKWLSFNAPCCVHNGESADTRKRGGVITNEDGGVSYHCFNCNYKTSYQPGRPLSYKFRKLLDWLGAPESTVQRMIVEALRVKDMWTGPTATVAPKAEVSFKPRPLPDDSVSFNEMATYYALAGETEVPDHLVNCINYVHGRRIDMDKYDFYITEETSYNLDKRVIVPFYWKHELIGYTSRAIVDGIKPKYHNSHDSNFVFNTDRQLTDAKFVLVMEGPFDAMSIDGVAILGSEASDQQIDIIAALNREVIVIPDFDVHYNDKGRKVWPGHALIETALDNGWSVSFPLWLDQCKDVASAVEHLGKLFTLKSILDAKQSNPLKIELMSKKLYNKL
jgi:hypothetical protein